MLEVKWIKPEDQRALRSLHMVVWPSDEILLVKPGHLCSPNPRGSGLLHTV